MDEITINDFLSGFDDRCYPEAFLLRYELLECLASSTMGETLLVQDRLGRRYVAKCYTDVSMLSKITESDLLKKLHHSGLPAFAEEFRSDTMLCVVREFTSGTPLNRLKKPLSEAQVISVGLQLCDILSYLHAQTPPVIHRDLKPQNIILDESGKVTLIDFGISRTYEEGARADTVFFGTQEFAPPEQYGFSQTDGRADIFSLGVVLIWLLTGRTQLKGVRIKNRRLERILRRCTAFAPQDRYRDAKCVKRALMNADGHIQKRVLKACCAAAALFAALTAGFAIGRYTDVRPALFYNNAYPAFSEPLVEKAVRLQLGKADGEPIRVEELESVKEIYLYYDQTVKTQDEFYTMRSRVDSGQIAAGDEAISSLDDIVKLKNLQRLCIGFQHVSDISGLASLTHLEVLDIYACPIDSIEALMQLPGLKHFILQQCEDVMDISPMANCPKIAEIVLSNLRIKDFSALNALGGIDYLHIINMDAESCIQQLSGKTVKELKICNATLTTIDGLENINGLETLIIEDVDMQSLAGIENLTSLKLVRLKGMPRVSLEPLKSLPMLETVFLSENMREAAAAIEGAGFEIKYE
jgi:tRNA A-37 threonylcarbamoyl transferase component Bud32